MASKRHHKRVIRQPARETPVYAREAERPLLDWGDEEPDEVWEALYDRGLVDPPYRGRQHGQTIAEIVMTWKPIGHNITDEYLVCALGRCDCCQ